MAYITKKQLEEILKNAPPNSRPDDVMGKLLLRGHAIEGYTKSTPKIETPDLLKRAERVVTSVFPGKQIGKSIGTLGALGFEKAKGLLGGEDRSEFINTEDAPTPLQVGADVANIGLNVAGFKGAGATGNFTQRVLKNIGLGAGLAGTRTTSEGGNLAEIGKSVAGGAAIGGAIPVVGSALGAIGRQISTLPSRFVNSALSRTKAQVLQDIAKDKVDDFTNYVLKSKPIGTANKLLTESYDNLESLNNTINQQLASAVRTGGEKATIGVNNFFDELAKVPEAQGALLKRADIRAIVERLAPQTKQLLQKPSLTVAEANKLRQLVDKTLGDRAFLGGQLSSDKIILKAFANNLRELVKTKAPEGTRKLFAELSNEIRFRDGLLDRIAKRAGNQVLSFGDFIGGGLGGVFGGGFGGAVAGVAARRAIESVPFKLTAAKVANALTKAAPTLEQLTPAQQTVIMDLFSELFSPDETAVDKSENGE